MGSAAPCVKDSYAGVSEIDLTVDGNELVASNVISNKANNGLSKIISGAERGLFAERPPRIRADAQQGGVAGAGLVPFSVVQAQQTSRVGTVGSLGGRDLIEADNGRPVLYQTTLEVSITVLYGANQWPKLDVYGVGFVDGSNADPGTLVRSLEATSGGSLFYNNSLATLSCSLTWNGLIAAGNSHGWGGSVFVNAASVNDPYFVSGYIRASYIAFEVLP